MECLGKLIGKLPPHWNPMMEDGGIHLLKYSPGRAKVVQRSIFLSSDRKLQAFFHGKELSPDHFCSIKMSARCDREGGQLNFHSYLNINLLTIKL